MFSFASKFLINHENAYLKPCYIRYIQTLVPSLNSAPSSISDDQQSLTVSYLTNSCGLSLQKAISATKHVNIERREKTDLVLQLLRAHGFTKSHIISLISRRHHLILADPEKTLKPKIAFFESLDIAKPDITKILCGVPKIWSCSLKNRILPTFDFLRGLLETDEKAISVLKRCPRVLSHGTDAMVSNVGILRAQGVPEPNIRSLCILEPLSLMLRVDLFEQVVQEVKQMGFEPTNNHKSFIYALRTMSVMSRSRWERKKELLMGFGWSEIEFLLAFRLQPFFMLTSEKKMKLLMEFFFTKLSAQSSDIVKYPNLFLASFERRIIPRYSALQLLMSKGLICKNASFFLVFNMSKEQFEKKFIICFKQDCPELTKVYLA